MKSATKYVCWVAGLAVALGIWVWLASVPWPASASPADTAVSALFPTAIWTGLPASFETGCPSGYYRAASGDCVHRPVCGVSSPPQGATALCNDGCYSFSENADMDETCSRNGGTKQVLN